MASIHGLLISSVLSCLLCSLLLSISAAQTVFPKAAQPTKSGYLPVAANSSSAIFYAFYEARQPAYPLSSTPLLVWLQGGPGCSSMVGIFFEFGPWLVDTGEPKLVYNPYSWNRFFGLLFLDNPIGSGFSIAAAPEEIPRDQTAVARHLFAAIQLFLSSNTLFRLRPLYIAGESYGGKYVPAIGHYILEQNSQLMAQFKINLRGVAIGNGLTHPVMQVATHARTAYFSGLISDKQKAILEELQSNAVRLTEEGDWSAATSARSMLLDVLQNMTGLATLMDLRKKKPYQTQMLAVFLNKDEVKAALGANKGIVWEECSDMVARALHDDVMKSTKFMVDVLVKERKVLLYQGQFDLRDGVVSSEAWMKEIDWEGLQSFQNAERKVWKVKGELAGYVQRWGSLSHVVVSGAGHLVPADQMLSTQAMIENWVLEKGLFSDDLGFRRSY